MFGTMKLMKTYKFKLSPNVTQTGIFNQWLGTCRFLYNLALEHRIQAFQSAKHYVNYYDQANELKAIKKTAGFEWIKNVQSQVLQDVLKRVERSYKNFFNGSGFPKWAKYGKYKSFTFPQITKLNIKGCKIRIPKIGFVKFRQHRGIKGKPKQIQIIKQLNSFYICIVCEVQPSQPRSENQATGIDLGVQRLATLSDGTFFENPMYYKQYQRRLRIKQRRLSRQEKFGANWHKTLHQVKKLHLKIVNCRKDYLHKVSHAITSKYNILFVEDLNLKGMTKSAKGTAEAPGKMVTQKSGLNRSLLDSGLSMFLTQLAYKTLHQSGFFEKVNPAYTSQACHNCGHTCKENRKRQSNFKCVQCSFALNADENAAKNIRSAGMALLPLTWGVDPSVGKDAPMLASG